MQPDVAPDCADIDGPAARLGVSPSANVIEVHAAAAALRLHTPGDSRGIDVAALGFNLHQVDFARDVDGEFSGELVRASALPVANNPSCVSANVSADFEGLELMA